MTLSVQAVEIYFNDCYDLLNNKTRVMIQGFGRNVNALGGKSTMNNRMNVAFDEKGKWVSPDMAKKVAKKTEYEMSGTKDIDIGASEDITTIIQTIEATRTAKSHNLNDRSSRSHCVITLKLR